ncbi:MAG: glycosyltransferase family 39 protein [Planctomycetota bacterium]
MPAMPDREDSRYRRPLFLLVAGTALFRWWLANRLELTSDECNGWLYARFPAPGYFDHPPLWGYLIRLATWGASIPAELLVRLPAIVLSAATTLLLYDLVRALRGPAVAWYTVLLFNSSYLFTAIGIVILPDTPLYFFWLLTLSCLVKGLGPVVVTTRERRWVLFSGVALGLALLSKYHASLIVPGVLGYLATDPKRRAWLKRPEPWIALAIALVLFLPVILWNYEHDWVSLRFQGGRMASAGRSVDHRRLLVNVLAPILYLNPHVFWCVLGGLLLCLRGRIERARDFALLLWVALPLIGFFAITSITNPASLPHWPGVGYFTLLPLGGTFLQARLARRAAAPLVPRATLVSAAALGVALTAALLQLDHGVIDLDRSHRGDAAYREWGASDKTTEMIGWRELAAGVQQLRDADRAAGRPVPELLLASRWYTAAHLDFYVGARLGLDTVCMADLDQERARVHATPSRSSKARAATTSRRAIS